MTRVSAICTTVTLEVLAQANFPLKIVEYYHSTRHAEGTKTEMGKERSSSESPVAWKYSNCWNLGRNEVSSDIRSTPTLAPKKECLQGSYDDEYNAFTWNSEKLTEQPA